MNVLVVKERGLHAGVTRHVRKHPQLDLRIVRVHQLPARLGHEGVANLAPQLRAHRDVLQVRLARGNAARTGHGLFERGVNPPVRAAHARERRHIGAVQLLILAVFQNQPADGIVRGQLLKHFRGGAGVLFAARRGNAQILK